MASAPAYKSWRMTPPFWLFLTFMVLKLCGVIDWSWWWVTAPLWAPAIVAVVIAVVYLIYLIVKEYRADVRAHKKENR